MNATNDREPTTLEPTTLETEDTQLKQKVTLWGNRIFSCFAFLFVIFELSFVSDTIIKLVYVAEPSKPGEPRAFNWDLFWVEVGVYFAVFASVFSLGQALARLLMYMRRPSVVKEDTFEDEKLLEKGLN